MDMWRCQKKNNLSLILAWLSLFKWDSVVGVQGWASFDRRWPCAVFVCKQNIEERLGLSGHMTGDSPSSHVTNYSQWLLLFGVEVVSNIKVKFAVSLGLICARNA